MKDKVLKIKDLESENNVFKIYKKHLSKYFKKSNEDEYVFSDGDIKTGILFTEVLENAKEDVYIY